ncbi:MAG: hypothetical protein ACLFP1_08525 [Candidatus Goldiibacteriota bacterium]
MKKFLFITAAFFLFMSGCASSGHRNIVFDEKTEYSGFFEASLLAVNEMGYQLESADKDSGVISAADYTNNVWYAALLPRLSIVIIKTQENLIVDISDVSRSGEDKAGEFLRKAGRKYAGLTDKEMFLKDKKIIRSPAGEKKNNEDSEDKKEEKKEIPDSGFDTGADAEIELKAEVQGFMMSPAKTIKNKSFHDWSGITVYFIYEDGDVRDVYIKKADKISRNRSLTVKPDNLKTLGGEDAPEKLGAPDIVRVIAYEKGKKGFYEKTYR